MISVSKLTKKLDESLSARLVAYFAGSFIVPGIVFTALISIGYASLASTGAQSYQVACLGFPIYEITRSTGGLSGQVVGTTMSLMGMSSFFVLVLVGELVHAVRTRGVQAGS